MSDLKLPVSVCTKTGAVFLRDAMNRPIAHFGDVRNVDGKVLNSEHFIEGATKAAIAESVAKILNA